MRRHAEDQYIRALVEDVDAALEASVGQFAKAVGLPFNKKHLHDKLDAAPFGSWDTTIEAYVRKWILSRLLSKLERAFENRLLEGLDEMVGLEGQEAEFWNELEDRMKGRPFGDYYEVAPDLMDEFYRR
jgi:hypothetical protein